MSFVEARLLDQVRYGATGGPGFDQERVSVQSGQEQVILRSTTPRHRYEITMIKRQSDSQALLTAFMATRGGAIGFRFKDPWDWTSAADHMSAPTATDQLLGVGDGATRTWPLVKLYTWATLSTSRRIAKPVAGTVAVAVDATPAASGWTLDAVAGTVTFAEAPSAGAVLTWGGTFDVPVRFDSPSLDRQLIASLADQFSFHVTEIVDPGMITEETWSGGARVVTIAADLAIHPALARLWVVTPTDDGQGVVLPDASTLQPGGPLLVVSNASGEYGLNIVDALGSTLLTLEAGASGTLWLAAASEAGSWVITVSGTVTAGNPSGWFAVAASDELTPLEAGTAAATFRLPAGMTLTGVRASLTTASTSGAVTVDVNANGTSIFGSQKLQIDQDETTSTTAALSPTLATTELSADDEITVDIDAAGTGATGLKVYLLGQQA